MGSHLAGRDGRGEGPAAAILRQVVPVAVALWFLWIMRGQLGAIDAGAVIAVLRGIDAWAWCGAGLATWVSFRAVGRYDALVQRSMALPTRARAARRSGAAAIAVAQVVGLGLVSGAVVRWRLQPALGLRGAFGVTVRVAVSFLSAWAVLTLAALALLPLPAGFDARVPAGASAGLVLLAGLAWSMRDRLLPGLPFALRLLGQAAIDCGAAALAFWLLLPEDCAISLVAVVPVYLVALGASLLAGLPGGLGVFEVAVLTALPGVAPEELLATCLAFRAVYYALPGLWAAAVMVRGPLRARKSPCAAGAARAVTTLQRREDFIARAPRAEAGLLRQEGHDLVALRRCGWLTAPAGATLVALLDPTGGRHAVAGLLPELTRRARHAGQRPCLYKVGPATAAAARRAGWVVRPVAQELWLDPRAWTATGPGLSGLRRKLRKAAGSELTITAVLPGGRLPVAAMARVAAAWSARQGRERGLSMGRYTPGYAAFQRVFLASHQGRLVAFLTLHAGLAEWTVDLMRQEGGAPDGTMQALVAAAISAAADLGVPRLSLAGACLPQGGEGAVAALCRWVLTRDGAMGLRQFKEAFAPRHQTLYAAAPTPLALVLAMADLIWAIRHPAFPARVGSDFNGIHHLRDEDEIESLGAPWHIGSNARALRRATVAERHQDERPSFPSA